METIFYHDNLDSPLTLNITPVQIKQTGSKISFKDFNFSEEQKNYLTRYINPERNSRMNSVLPPNHAWKIKWRSKIDSSAIPWYLLIKNDRLIVQNESGWQLFDLSGNLINSGIKAMGDIIISKSDKSFYINDPSGYIQNVDLDSGKRKFYVYPYLGKGFKRSVIYTNGNKIIDSGSVGLLLFGTLVFLLTSYAIAVLFSTLARNTHQAVYLTVFSVLPSTVISGFMVPTSTMPRAIQIAALGLPATHYVTILRAVVVRGAHLADVAAPLVALTAILAIVVAGVLATYPRRLDR